MRNVISNHILRAAQESIRSCFYICHLGFPCGSPETKCLPIVAKWTPCGFQSGGFSIFDIEVVVSNIFFRQAPDATIWWNNRCIDGSDFRLGLDPLVARMGQVKPAVNTVLNCYSSRERSQKAHIRENATSNDRQCICNVYRTRRLRACEASLSGK